MAIGKAGKQLLLGWLVVAFSMPAVLGIEALLRRVILPPDFELVRRLLQPYLTPVVWGLVPVCLLSTWAAFSTYRRLRRKARHAGTPTEAAWKRFEGMMIATSVAQIPGLVAAFASMAGAALAAVLSVVIASSLGVLAMGVLLAPDLGDAGPAATEPGDDGS